MGGFFLAGPVMSGMPDSLPLWVGAAVALFWFVGAYNRVVRLRSAALAAYALLDAALVRQIDFVQARAADLQSKPQDIQAGASVQAAAGQLVTLLAATRLHPLQPTRIAALATALHVMLGGWQRLHPDAVISFDADGTLSRPAALGDRNDAAAGAAPMAWPEPSAAAEIARNQFNLAVAQYNTAIRQFPALLVAWIMQLRPAAPLR